MKTNFEVIAYKDGKRTVRYYCLVITDKIMVQLYDKFQELGYRDIRVRMI